MKIKFPRGIYYFRTLLNVATASALVILFLGLNVLSSYPDIILLSDNAYTAFFAQDPILLSSVNFELPFSTRPVIVLTILAASSLVIGSFGLNVPSWYPFIYPAFTAFLCYLSLLY